MIGGVAAAGEAEASATASELVQGFLTAYNGQDVDYFQKSFADDSVVLDEDGHTISGKELLMRIIGRRLSATPAAKLAASDITGGNTANAAWGSFNYTFTQGETERAGFVTAVFKKSGDDWQIAHLQFSFHSPGKH